MYNRMPCLIRKKNGIYLEMDFSCESSIYHQSARQTGIVFSASPKSPGFGSCATKWRGAMAQSTVPCLWSANVCGKFLATSHNMGNIWKRDVWVLSLGQNVPFQSPLRLVFFHALLLPVKFHRWASAVCWVLVLVLAIGSLHFNVSTSWCQGVTLCSQPTDDFWEIWNTTTTHGSASLRKRNPGYNEIQWTDLAWGWSSPFGTSPTIIDVYSIASMCMSILLRLLCFHVFRRCEKSFESIRSNQMDALTAWK